MAKPKRYRIVPIKHLLKNNQIAHSGDVVLGSAFVNLQDSINGGYCVETEESLTELNHKSKKPKEILDELEDLHTDVLSKEQTIKHVKSLNKEPLKEWAAENGYSVDKSLNVKKLKKDIIRQVEEKFDEEE